MQLAKFSLVHLVAGGWYLDCSRGFVPDVEEAFYNSLVSSAPKLIELEKIPEEDHLALPSNEKNVGHVKVKDKGRNVAHISSQVSTCYFIKALVQHTVVPTTTMVRSSTVTPSAPSLDPIAALSHSGVTIPLVLHKRKVVARDTSATSSERSFSFFFV